MGAQLELEADYQALGFLDEDMKRIALDLIQQLQHNHGEFLNLQNPVLIGDTISVQVTFTYSKQILDEALEYEQFEREAFWKD